MNVLYFSYNGLAEPLGRSQILPYLAGLAERGHRFTVVSFEKAADPSRLAREEVAALLPAESRWVSLTYHQRPTLPATAWDVLEGALAGMKAGPHDLLHARGTVAAPMAALVSSLRGLPWIFDVRGLLAQEYVDAERWPAGGLLDRLTRSAERSLVRRADGLVFLTRRVVAQLREDGTVHEGQPVGIIPCAVDVDRFSPDLGARVRIRRELGLGNRPVMTYAGSLGSWYLPAAMLDFFDAARSSLPGLHFLVLTPQAPVMGREVARRGFERDVTVRTVSPAAVPAHLAAADFGISFIAASPSKIASSPTKLAEYLACGLPVVVNPGVGDVEELKQEPAWVVVDRLDRESYERAALRLRGLLAQPDGRETARELAVRRFALARAVEAYDDLYRRLVVGRCA